MAKLVSSTYGDALFTLALEEDLLDPLMQEATALKLVWTDHDEIRKLIGHPELTKEEKLDFLENVFRERLSGQLLGFLRIMVEKDRVGEILSAIDHFLYRAREHKGIGRAQVTSAVPLRDEQKEAVERRLVMTSSYDSFEMDYRVAPEILGGLVIRIEDRVVDSSLKTQIERLSRQLSSSDAGGDFD